MLDLFGRGVVLLDFGAETGAVDALHRAAQIARIPLAIHRADLPEIARLYERKLVLVRPDGHVAWRDDYLPQSVEALLGRITGHADVGQTQ